MVERLKAAIEKARKDRERAMAVPPAPSPVPKEAPDSPVSAEAWSAIAAVETDLDHLQRHRVISFTRDDPAHATFDLLRTQLVKLCRQNGWRRVAVTSPTKGCGKSTVCANIAGSMSQQKSFKTILIDLDLRSSHIHKIFGIKGEYSIPAVLDDEQAIDRAIVRIGDNLGMLLNTKPVPGSAELLQGASMTRLFGYLEKVYAPDLVLIDTPPILVADDVIGLTQQIDAVLMVIASGSTVPSEFTAAEKLLADGAPLIGVVLNRVPEESLEPYQEGYT